MRSGPDRNVLFIVLDQLRADCLGCPGPLSGCAKTPHLNALKRDAVAFERHYAVMSPCGPSRASLLTGLYGMNHRSVRNGVPLAAGIPNVATEVRKVGYEPLLFGYTDTAPDPRRHDPNDPELRSYERVIPGFRELVELRLEEPLAWCGYLGTRGYSLPSRDRLFAPRSVAGQPSRPDNPPFYSAEDSDTAFLTNKWLEAMAVRDRGWFAHLTYLRPHPPLVAPAPYNTMFLETAISPPVRPDIRERNAAIHPFVSTALKDDLINGCIQGDGKIWLDNLDHRDVQCLRRIYLGLLSEADNHIGRIVEFLKRSGQYGETLIVITSDHGELLGDHFLWGKRTFHESAFHVPLIIRDPDNSKMHGSRISAFSESVDIVPTILEWIGRPVPRGMDGTSLLPFLDGSSVANWRDYVYGELDFGDPEIPTRWQVDLGLSLREANLAIIREERYKLVYFNGGLAPLLFDMCSETGEATDLADQVEHYGTLVRLMRKLLDHRMRCQSHDLSDMKVTAEGTVNHDP